MAWIFLAGLLVGSFFGYWLVRRPRKQKFLLHQEYWVYLPTDQMPPQDAVMSHLVRPAEGQPWITGKEALIFSDIRLHIALVLRAKNAYLFRPDIMAPYVDATSEQLSALESAKSFAKVRFLSEEPVLDDRYRRFLPQAARAIAALGQGTLIYDVIGERLLTPDELASGDPGPNIRWVAEATGGHVETLGLRKLGLSEIHTAPVAADERWIVTEIVTQVARQIWRKGDLPSELIAEAYEDRFRLDLEQNPNGTAIARIHRIQSA